MDLKKKKFLIIAPEYADTNGGVIVQHKLCHLLNSVGYEAYLYPLINCRINDPHGRLRSLWNGLKDDIGLLKYRWGKKFVVNPYFKTPLWKNFDPMNSDEWIVVYGEVVTGNPLRAKNVIRWLLHQPGYFSKIVCYGRGELYFKYGSGIKDFYIDGSRTSPNKLNITHYPTEYYNMDGVASRRDGVAYCIRKGRNKSQKDLPKGAILIDEMGHEQVSKILKRVRLFISYDDYTAYSKFALMCGCDSVVVPSEGVSEEQWCTEESARWGIAYGMDRLSWARGTAHLQLSRIEQLMKESEETVRRFALEAMEYFQTERDMGYRSKR